MSSETVLTVCVNWNGARVLESTLDSLLKSDYSWLRHLVVDNASSDGSPDLVPATIPVLRLDQNRGYAGGVNAAVEAVEKGGVGKAPDFFLLLNNDLRLASDCISRLVECARREGAAIAGPRIRQMRRPELLEAAWGEICWNHVVARYYGKNAEIGTRWEQTCRVQLLLGSVLLVRRQVFEEIGPMDERFFMYHEEVDFLYRAGRKGFFICYCPGAEAFHLGGHSTREIPEQKTFWLRRNSVLFFKKHRPGTGAWMRFWITLCLSLAYNLGTLKWKRARAIWQGVAEGLKLD